MINHICISINASFYEISPIILTPLIFCQNLDKWKFSISSLGKQNKNIMMFMNEYYNFVHIVIIRCLKTKITEKWDSKIMKTVWPKSKRFFLEQIKKIYSDLFFYLLRSLTNGNFHSSKGQLISKANCQAMNSSKKRKMKSFLLLCNVFSFIFWKKLKTPRKPFENTWLLAKQNKKVTIFLNEQKSRFLQFTSQVKLRTMYEFKMKSDIYGLKSRT